VSESALSVSYFRSLTGVEATGAARRAEEEGEGEEEKTQKGEEGALRLSVGGR